MDQQRYVEVYGDSILRGVQVSEEDGRYVLENNIDISMLEKKFRLKVSNFSRFGCTITKALGIIERKFKGGDKRCDAVIMNLGGNDCDFNWKAISEDPEGEHEANTPLEIFAETYKKIIAFLKERGVRPIITNLPPLDAQKFFDWFCAGLSSSANILRWLGSVDAIYRWQEKYSRAIERVAAETDTLLVDIRGAFLEHRKLAPLLCADGTHPNTEGQKVITKAFLDFIHSARSKGMIELYA